MSYKFLNVILGVFDEIVELGAGIFCFLFHPESLDDLFFDKCIQVSFVSFILADDHGMNSGIADLWRLSRLCKLDPRTYHSFIRVAADMPGKLYDYRPSLGGEFDTMVAHLFIDLYNVADNWLELQQIPSDF
jgi:hypothetical protein